jgi:hypothetical protein
MATSTNYARKATESNPCIFNLNIAILLIFF